MRGLYLADCEDTAWAEWLRATAEQGVPGESLPLLLRHTGMSGAVQ